MSKAKGDYNIERLESEQKDVKMLNQKKKIHELTEQLKEFKNGLPVEEYEEKISTLQEECTQLRDKIEKQKEEHNRQLEELRDKVESVYETSHQKDIEIQTKLQGEETLKQKIQKQEYEILQARRIIEDHEELEIILKSKVAQMEEQDRKLHRRLEKNEECNIVSEEYKIQCIELQTKVATISELYEREKANSLALSKVLQRKEEEIEELKNNKLQTEIQLQKIEEVNEKAQKEQRKIYNTIRAKDDQLISSQLKIDELNTLLQYQIKKEEDMRTKLNKSEYNAYEYQHQVRKESKEKEPHTAMEERKKYETEPNKKPEKYSLVNEKRRLESKLLSPDIQIIPTKKSIDLLRKSQEASIDDSYQKQKQMDALISHIDVLQSQNSTLKKELQNTVKPENVNRLQAIHQIHSMEIMKSSDRVKNASPNKISPI